MKILVPLIVCLALILAAACAGGSPAAVPTAMPTAAPTATPNLEATVQAAVSAALPTPTSAPTPDINATVAAGIAATRAAVPTPTPVPSPTPDLDATVEARMAATIAAMPNLTPTPTPTATPVPTPVPTATPTPTTSPTATPVPTPTPTPTPTPVPTNPPAALLTEMVSRARPAVVRIDSGSVTGSGAIFETQGRTGYVITNHHVVEGVAEVSVTVNDSATYRGTVLGTDNVRDLAVVRICCGSFSKLSFGDASALEPGNEVVAIGYALGLSGEATITRGIVSAIRYDSRHLSDLIQTDAAINPGNSGGPMLSLSGEILGINTFKVSETSVEGLGFAISETTVQQRIPFLRAGRPAPTPMPTPSRPRPTPAPSTDGGYAFGPVAGELWHDPSDGFIKTESAGVYLSDFIVTATFVNPYAASSNDWDYGFIFREEDAGRAIHIVVTSDRRWTMNVGDEPPRQQTAQGRLASFDSGAGGQNTLWVLAVGDSGLLFINGEFISMLDLSPHTGTGDISVSTGNYEGGEVAGAVTKFEGFVAVPLNRSYGPAAGTLEYEPGFISAHDSYLWARDLVAEAEFTNPPGRDWDYGFIIRNPESDRLEVIGVTGDNWWFHNTRDVGDAEYTDVAEGRLSVNLRSKNHLLLFALEDTGLFFVNGELVARLDLSHNLDYGDISAIGGFFSNHTGEPEFENFNVWTP